MAVEVVAISIFVDSTEDEEDLEEAKALEIDDVSFVESMDISDANALTVGKWHKLVGPQTWHPRHVSEW